MLFRTDYDGLFIFQYLKDIALQTAQGKIGGLSHLCQREEGSKVAGSKVIYIWFDFWILIIRFLYQTENGMLLATLLPSLFILIRLAVLVVPFALDGVSRSVSKFVWRVATGVLVMALAVSTGVLASNHGFD